MWLFRLPKWKRHMSALFVPSAVVSALTFYVLFVLVNSFPLPNQPSSISQTKVNKRRRHAHQDPRIYHTTSPADYRLPDDTTRTCVENHSAVDELLVKAGLSSDKQNLTITKLSSEGAFCNSVYQISQNPVSSDLTFNSHHRALSSYLFAKIFSNVSLERMNCLEDPSLHRIGVLDRAIALRGLSPRVVACSDRGILTEQCPGRSLTERDLHQNHNAQLCRLVATSLARLHSVSRLDYLDSRSGIRDGGSPGQRKSLIWHSCQRMLAMSHPLFQHQGWSIERFHQELEHQRFRLDRHYNLTLVDVGHGDFKPANVFYDVRQSCVKFIDLELAGPQYRSYDLAKFFRTEHPTEFTVNNQKTFYMAYLKNLEMDASSTTLEDIQQEVSLILPLTWLEAAIFFVCMANQDPSPRRMGRWTGLIENRLLGYQRSMNTSIL